MKVVVTGGAGFIGAHLCRSLAAESMISSVVALDNLSTGHVSNLDGVGATLVEGDIRNPQVLDEVFAEARSVIHLAARPSVPRSIENPVESHAVNTTGTLTVLEAVRRIGVPHVVVASSSSVYGGNPTLPKSESLKPSPQSPYAAQKLATETYTLAHAHCFGFNAVAFRLFNVFGPLQSAGHAYAAVIPSFVSAAISGRPLPVHGDGEQTRDFTYVESVTRVITRAVVDGLASEEPINLAFGNRYSLLEVISELEQIVGRTLQREHLPPRPGDVRDSQADQRRLRAVFRDVDPVPLSEGLRATVDWFHSKADHA